MKTSIQQRSENNIQTYNQDPSVITASILLAFERTSTKPERLKGTVSDVIEKYSYLDTVNITDAIKRGSLGDFGSCYKLSTTEICVWINKHLDSLKQQDINHIKKTNEDILAEEAAYLAKYANS